MAEPTNAERVNRYFRSIGIAPRARRAPRPELEDDDIDVEIGAARIEPEEDLDVQFGDAQVEDDDIEIGDARVESRETVVPEIRIEGDVRPVQSQGVRNVTAALPEFLSEPFDRATRDPDSTFGGIARAVIDAPLFGNSDDLQVDADTVRGARDGRAARRPASPHTLGTLASDESRDAARAFGDRFADAVPIGLGEELYTGIRLGADPGYTRPRLAPRPDGTYSDEEQARIDRGEVTADEDMYTDDPTLGASR